MEDVVVESNQVDATDAAANKTGTRATLSAQLPAGASEATLDFSRYLMFRTPIDAASVRCWLYGPHATALSAETVGAGEGMGEGMSRVARVRLGEAVPVKVQGEMVTCSIDHSSRACPAH